MSSWHPPRSPSAPYRARRYSPSREVSPPPSNLNLRREDHYRPSPQDTYRPTRSEYNPPPPRPRSRSRSPLPRYHDARYRDISPPPAQRYRSPPPPVRRRPGAADFYDDPAPRVEERRAMVADREENRERERTKDFSAPRVGNQEDRWERGHEVQSQQSEYGRGYDYGRGEIQTQTPEERYYGDDRNDGQSRRGGGGKTPSERSRDVILLGLDDELTDDDLASFLKAEHGANIVSVKIVRDRTTGKTKNFGFAHFQSIEDAEDFVLPNFPYITMPALYAHSEAQKVKIDFSTPLGNSAGPSSAPTDYQQPIEPVRRHDGTRHIGQPGGGKRVLLFRMLDWNTGGQEIIWRTSQEIARLLNKQGREKEAEHCIVRVATIQDKLGRGASWGFAFVELVTGELAAGLLSFLLSPQSQPHGFLIASRPIAISFADPASFKPASAGPLGGQFLLRASSNGGIGSETINKPDGQWCAYDSEQAGAAETCPERGQAISENGQLPELPPVLRSLLGIYAGKDLSQVETATAPVPPTGGLINIASVMQPIKIGTSINFGGKGKKEDGFGFTAAGPSRKAQNLFGDEEESDLVGKDTVLLSRTKGAHIVPPTSGSRKIAKNIFKWNTKQSELAAPEPATRTGMPKGVSSANAVLGPRTTIPSGTNITSNQPPAQVVASSSKAQIPSLPVADEYDYSDAQASEVMRKHVLTSDLHKSNLANTSAVEAGKKRKQAAIAKSTATLGDDTPKYRDRAAERREVFNQPEKPSYLDRVALSIPSGPPKRKFAEGPKEPSPPPEPGLAPGMDEGNKGNTLLTKMGWEAGTGLGKEKEGRVEPIQVKLLGERAGLGAKR